MADLFGIADLDDLALIDRNGSQPESSKVWSQEGSACKALSEEGEKNPPPFFTIRTEIRPPIGRSR